MAGGRTPLSILIAAVLVLVLGGGCGLIRGDSPNDDAGAFARALSAGNLSQVSVANVTPRQAQQWWERTRAGMGDSTQQVRVTRVRELDGGTATATLSHVWHLGGSPAGPRVDWRYDTTVRLVRRNGSWAVDLEPSVVAPRLGAGERLALSMVAARRGDIVGAGGRHLVEERPVVHLGIDKGRVPAAREADSARRLAALLGIDAGSYTTRVKASGDKAFVEALVLRQSDVTARIKQGYPGIPGARAVYGAMPLAPTREFARALLGTVGPVTAEMIKKSHGRYAVGDEVGLSGLEQRYDGQLRGRPGMVVKAVGERGQERELFRARPQDGTPLRVTLDEPLQTEAEQALARVRPASALVAVRPSTGAIVAAANGPGSQGYPTGTVGRYAPGSTFKVVSSLALLRSGLRPDDRVPCPRTTVVDGKLFENYADYPASALGTITLREAVAQSCNTAFISERSRASAAGLVQAAESLGLGKDYDVGFPAYFGSVPTGGTETGHAAAVIGQGQVLASPLAMAAVAASVGAGRTVVPHLLTDTKAAASPSKPLTRNEAAQLRGLMAAVVQEGSGRVLAGLPGPPVLAKTGTAEFGDANPPQTHAWMIAVQGDLAVAVFVDVGQTGSHTAGPVLEQFLRAARS